MIKTFFNTLSTVFHPIFLPILGLYFLFKLPASSPSYIESSLFSVDEKIQYFSYFVFFILLIVAPGLSILIMYWNKLISSFKMETQIERAYALGIMLMYALFLYFILRNQFLESINYKYLLIYTFAITLTITVSFILNFFVKVSLHAIGVFGLVGALVGYFNNQINYNILFLVFFILLAGIISSGRIYLKSHKLPEVLLGMFVGFVIEFLCMKFGWFL